MMKRSKSDPSSKKKKSKHSVQLRGVKTKRKSSGTSKTLPKEKGPRKTRWEEASVTVETDSPSIVKTEENDLMRIKELLSEDKDWIVEQLFQTVTGTALDDLIPDYLKKHSAEELKKICKQELEKMSNDDILGVYSGKQTSALEDKETQTDFNAELKQAGVSNKETKENKNKTSCMKELLSSEKSESGLESMTSSKMNQDEKIQASDEVLDKVAKDLGVSEGDSELLELEMRARAIRSLLKMKPSLGDTGFKED